MTSQTRAETYWRYDLENPQPASDVAVSSSSAPAAAPNTQEATKATEESVAPFVPKEDVRMDVLNLGKDGNESPRKSLSMPLLDAMNGQGGGDSIPMGNLRRLNAITPADQESEIWTSIRFLLVGIAICFVAQKCYHVFLAKRSMSEASQ